MGIEHPGRRALHAFSLVELSIVLVLLGLMVGGILSGRSLLRASEVRSVLSDLDSYKTSTQLFRDKFKALPGDMPNATRFWGIRAGSTGSDNACVTVGSTNYKATCNGDGDGRVFGEDSSYGDYSRFEIYLAWQHLANAGLVEGQYSGFTGPDDPSRHTVLGINAPKSRVPDTGFDFWWIGEIVEPDDHLFPEQYGTIISYGATKDSDIANGPALTPSEAWSIDKKSDDAKPQSGSVRVYKAGAFGNNYNCATTASAATAEYAVTTTSKQCAMMFLTGF